LIRIGDSFEEIFETEKEAVKSADSEWNHLNEFDKKRRERYCVAEVTIDEDGLIDYNESFRIVKSYR
jgi:hypothetical protein